MYEIPFAMKWVICSAGIALALWLIALVVYLILRHQKKIYGRFFRVLWIDLKAKIGEDAILPTDINQALKFYPGLPKFDACMELPVKELVAKVSWTIDPREHGLSVPQDKIHWRRKNVPRT